ncbi:MAG: peptidylprolyl isomerase [Elusimicrobiota bacterium]|nr:peptidylprolyl isomerase [Elusimicrobiota bacterium]
MKKVNFAKFCLFLLFLIGLVACNKKEEVLVKTKDEIVSTKDFEDRLKEVSYFYNPDFLNSEQGKNQILDTIVRETVMLQLAKDKGYDKREDYQSKLKNFERQTLVTDLIRDLRDTELKVSDEEIANEFDKDKDYYNAPKQIKVAHILVTDNLLADNILAELKNGVDFAVLASSYSIDSSSSNNYGELDWFGKGQMVPEFETAAFALKDNGDVSDVISSSFGFHIIKKLDERIGEPITFDAVKLNLTRLLERQKFDDWYNRNSENLKITIKRDILNKININEGENEE